MQFNQLNLIDPLQKAISDVQYTVATEIQSKAIPEVLNKNDILGCAQTGTGKTAAFAIPILQLLSLQSQRNTIQSLILAPTRELALQIEESFQLYGKYLPLKSLAIFGGVPQGRQVSAIKKGVDILIATPGRLLDLVQQKIINLSSISILVLDEADHMLDMGFINDVKKILEKIPTNRQTLFFSATMPKAIMKFAKSILNTPIEISVTPVSSTTQQVKQSVYYVEKKEKSALLIQVLKNKTIRQSLVFTRTKHGADRLVKQLGKANINAAAIHGDKSQNARQRALSEFKNNQIRVLVATDIAARGIDIDELPHVVNYELPNVPETYVHRIGRTGRAGKTGVALSFCDQEERDDLKEIQRLIGMQISVNAEIKNGRDLMNIQ